MNFKGHFNPIQAVCLWAIPTTLGRADLEFSLNRSQGLAMALTLFCEWFHSLMISCVKAVVCLSLCVFLNCIVFKAEND